MFLKLSLLVALTVATVAAEAPLAKSGPYPASGWRPQKPFLLPGEYLPPPAANQQQPQKVDVEISKERVEFAGQIQGNSLVPSSQPQNAYLPPSSFDDSAGSGAPQDNDFWKVQELPSQQRPQVFNKQQFAPRPRPQPERGDQPAFGQRLQPRPQPQQQNFRPSFRPQPQEPNFRPSFNPQPQPGFSGDRFFPQEQPKPAQEYGAPSTGDLNIVYPDPRNLPGASADEEQDVDDSEAAFDALKSAVNAYNRAQLKKNEKAAAEAADDVEDGDDVVGENNGYPYQPASGRFAQGQYYVLGPDNSLQRVMFTTSQDDNEAKTNGFTAQLKYTPVGEIKDPVFKYNERGQLMRILKK